MPKPKAKCCVCLNVGETVKISDLLLAKLEYVVPEVEWSSGYSICQPCTTQLEQACEFRDLCIQLDFNRKNSLTFTCYHCSAGFSDKKLLTEHINKQHKNFECDHCHKKYSTQKVLKAHKCESKVAKKTFSCEVCEIVMSQAKRIVEHCVSEHSMDKKLVKPFSCDECPMRFSSSANLIQHKKYHGGSRSQICSFCGKSYITKSDLTVHEYTHFNRRNYKCELCTKAFNTNKNLRSHMLVVHTDSSLWKYGCDLCTRRFPLKSGYEQHMKRHTGDKRFVCHICNKPFISRSELRKHMSFHSMEKPFECGHCGRTYKEKRHYEIHLTKAHGIGNAKIPVKERRYACHVCPSAFFDRQKLERHLRTHSGVKPYVCLHCEKKFSDKYYLKQHRKNVHGLEDEELDLQLIYKKFDSL